MKKPSSRENLEVSLAEPPPPAGYSLADRARASRKLSDAINEAIINTLGPLTAKEKRLCPQCGAAKHPVALIDQPAAQPAPAVLTNRKLTRAEMREYLERRFAENTAAMREKAAADLLTPPSDPQP